MALGLKNLAELISGGSKGIGLTCASAFLGEGGRANSDKAAQPLGDVVLVRADLTREDEAARVIPMDGGANPVI